MLNFKLIGLVIAASEQREKPSCPLSAMGRLNL